MDGFLYLEIGGCNLVPVMWNWALVEGLPDPPSAGRKGPGGDVGGQLQPPREYGMPVALCHCHVPFHVCFKTLQPQHLH